MVERFGVGNRVGDRVRIRWVGSEREILRVGSWRGHVRGRGKMY